MNYSQLVTAIKGYTENSFPTTQGMDSTTQTDTFIRNAEIRIYNRLLSSTERTSIYNFTG